MIWPSASITFPPAIVYLAPLKIGLTVLHPSCILPIEGRSGSKPFPSTRKAPALSAVDGLDGGESLSRQLHFAVGLQFVREHNAVAKRQQHVFHPWVVMNAPVQSVDDARIFFDWIEHAA